MLEKDNLGSPDFIGGIENPHKGAAVMRARHYCIRYRVPVDGRNDEVVLLQSERSLPL
jgi:hypothetical protein